MSFFGLSIRLCLCAFIDIFFSFLFSPPLFLLYSLNLVILRPGLVYGPYVEHGISKSFLIDYYKF